MRSEPLRKLKALSATMTHFSWAKRTCQLECAAAATCMLRVMRDETADPSRRDEMARAVAPYPYVHPKPAAVEQKDKDHRNIVIQISPKEAQG
jgi:hypothetical protein